MPRAKLDRRRGFLREARREGWRGGKGLLGAGGSRAAGESIRDKVTFGRGSRASCFFVPSVGEAAGVVCAGEGGRGEGEAQAGWWTVHEGSGWTRCFVGSRMLGRRASCTSRQAASWVCVDYTDGDIGTTSWSACLSVCLSVPGAVGNSSFLGDALDLGRQSRGPAGLKSPELVSGPLAVAEDAETG